MGNMDSSSNTKLEFAVRIPDPTKAESIKLALKSVPGIQSVGVDVGVECVVVETTLPSHDVLNLIESTGHKAALMGMGDQGGKHLGAAVSQISGSGAVGVTRLLQLAEDKCVVEGTIDGLKAGQYALNIHELGDISGGCDSCGELFDMNGLFKGKKYGELATIKANDSGRASFRLETDRVKVWDIIGRSMVLQTVAGLQSNRLACGIIARSAGVFENPKRICACDGVTVWDERNVPIAGTARQNRSDVNETAPAAQL